MHVNSSNAAGEMTRGGSGVSGPLIEHVAFQMSTGLFAYMVDLGRGHWQFRITTDEGRGLFYASTNHYDGEGGRVMQIHTLRGVDGVKIRSFQVQSSDDRDEAFKGDHRHGPGPELGYDPLRDVLLIHRSSLEIRDPLMGTLKGEIALLDHPDSYLEARILLDPDTDHAFIVYSGAWKDGRPTPGTPVTSIRLPPP